MAVRDRRIAIIGDWLVVGLQTKSIYARVSHAAAREKQARDLARQQLQRVSEDDPDEPTRPEDVPRIWATGDAWSPPSDRQVDQYIKHARRQIAAQGTRLNKSASRIYGLQWARINAVYRRAWQDKKWNVCARLIEYTGRLFNMDGAIALRVMFQEPPGEPAPAEAITHTAQPRELLPLTRETLEHEIAALIQQGRLRAQAQKRSVAPSAIAGPGSAN